MSEHYNQVFVFGAKLSASEISEVLAHDLNPLWDVLGRPDHLLTLDVENGTEEHASIQAPINEELLRCRPGTIFSIRGTESRMGTVQYYELGNYGVIAVSRPVQLLSLQQRLEWIRLLWSRLRRRGTLLAISGRELEVSAADLETAVRDWTTLRNVPMAELLVLSDSIVLAAPSSASSLEGGFLVQLLPDKVGGYGVH